MKIGYHIETNLCRGLNRMVIVVLLTNGVLIIQVAETNSRANMSKTRALRQRKTDGLNGWMAKVKSQTITSSKISSIHDHWHLQLDSAI
ncbi:hypothetical protein D3C72_1845920 [compost metagenome]